MMVFGIALLLSTPFILRAQNSIFQVHSGTEMVKLDNSLDNVETVIKTVSASGEPARRTFDFKVPESTVESGIDNNSIYYKVRTSESNSTVVRTFDVNITGSVPEESGTHRLTVYAEDGEIKLEGASP